MTRHFPDLDGIIGRKPAPRTDDLPLFGEVPKARATDPATSHDAAEAVRVRSGTAKHKLLKAYAQAGAAGLTDEEAAVAAGLSLASEYATRCSELTKLGLLAPTDLTRVGSSGQARIVRRITAQGYDTL
jgi:hypothetical protein